MKTAETAQPYEWDWGGECMPEANTSWGFETFSVGIFQWVPTKNGKGLKRAKVVKRIRGRLCDPEPVYQQAREECERRNKTS